MKLISKTKTSSGFYSLLPPAVAVIAGASSPASAQLPQPQIGELERCVAPQAYYTDGDAYSFDAKMPVVAGEFVFHSVALDETYMSGASINYTGSAPGVELEKGAGVWAFVLKDQPDTIQVYWMLNGEQEPLGTYPYGTPVPYKITFDDEHKTVTIESGEYKMTAPHEQPLRGTMNMRCVGSDVSFNVFPE